MTPKSTSLEIHVPSIYPILFILSKNWEPLKMYKNDSFFAKKPNEPMNIFDSNSGLLTKLFIKYRFQFFKANI